MEEAASQLAARFKALADPVRLRLVALCRQAECSVSELTRVTGQSQPRISQHLKALLATGLLERFRDGHFVFYRVSAQGVGDSGRRLLALLPADEPQFARDLARLRAIRSEDGQMAEAVTEADRSLHRALVELTVAQPLGDLLDVGCGQGRILKLLASRAKRAIGVDVDSDQRRLARAELLLAGTPGCSLRHGNMYDLPFDDASFDTVILDDVLPGSNDPTAAIAESSRLLRPGGRLLMLAAIGNQEPAKLRADYAAWAASAGLRMAPPRAIPSVNPHWLLAVAAASDLEAAVA